MTPIYGRAICHDPCHDPVTGCDKIAFSNLQVSRPLTLDVTVFSDFLSVKQRVSRLSQRHGYALRRRNM